MGPWIEVRPGIERVAKAPAPVADHDRMRHAATAAPPPRPRAELRRGFDPPDRLPPLFGVDPSAIAICAHEGAAAIV
jgi:hypothetical protein